MLTYLDALIAALAMRDAAEVDRLLGHPLVRILSVEARAEVEAMRLDDCDPLAAPLRVMQLRHQTAELLRDATVVADRAEVLTTRPRSVPGARRSARLVQMELPLSA